MKRKISIILTFAILLGISCAQKDAEKIVPQTINSSMNTRSDSAKQDIEDSLTQEDIAWEIIREIEHSTDAYTQGLFYHNGFLYEGTGQNGASSVRKLDAKTGKILIKTELENRYFGEGITLLNNKIYQLTWVSNTGFIYDLMNLKQTGTFEYFGQGWGLCTDGENLIMSDGTNALRFLNPKTFASEKTIMVIDENGAPLRNLNELEYINGEIWANVYLRNYIVLIEPKTGKVVRSIDMSELWSRLVITNTTDVLNGIAYDKKHDEYYLTGKNWDKIFVLKFNK